MATNNEPVNNVADARRNDVEQIVQNFEHVGAPKKSILLENEVFNHDDAAIKEEVIRMIIQYLGDEGYAQSMMTVQDEANLKGSEQLQRISILKRMKKAILEGDWLEVEKLLVKQPLKNQQSFLYAIYKQAYLELLERQEYQKAFTYLTKRLKPLENRHTNVEEFKDLCYLLTCKSVQDAAYFKNWDGAKGTSREKLVEQFQTMLDFEGSKVNGPVVVPPNRLLTLLRQAVSYQIEFSRYHPKVVPKVKTLLEDFSCFVLPNALKNTFVGHKKNVKSLTFVGDEGSLLASGSSDNTVRIWRTEDGSSVCSLTGHTSRIWDICSNNLGNLVASAGGDGAVKLWDLKNLAKPFCAQTLSVLEGDAYSVQFHPGQDHIVTGGYGKTPKLVDIRTGAVVKSFVGHNSSVCKTIFNPHGNLVISGSKDSTIKFWDIVSGLCIKTFSSHLGEVTSLDINQAGSLLLSGSKDNSNRLWDIRTSRPIKRLKGHQNTSKNFIRSAFGPNQSLIIGGSEDGFVYLWDVETGNLLQTLQGHEGMVYSAAWSQSQSLLASCSQDCTVRTWWYNPSLPVFCESEE